ncbi:MAG: hypothetical protein AAF720_11840 [Pseudomonadota bacterium]
MTIEQAKVPVAPTSALLEEVFGADAPVSETYLEWLYNLNPAGRVRERNYDEDGKRLGHYALIPINLLHAGERVTLGLSVNTAVSEKAQGKGLFSKLAAGVFDDLSGTEFMGAFGLANANSTPGCISRLSYKLIMPLPVNVGIRSIIKTSKPCTGDTALKHIVELENQVRSEDPNDIAFDWSFDTLRWRLDRPGLDYLCLSKDSIGLIARRINRNGVGFAVILGIFGRGTAITVARMISAACAQLGCYLYLYAGWNTTCPTSGIKLPERLKPSPLNLLWRTIGDQPTVPDLGRTRRFEFIEFDAY